MNNLAKFQEIRNRLDKNHPDRMFSFGVVSHQMEYSEVLYCQEMVRQGKLASFDHCIDQGLNEESSFGKTFVFYERGISVARRKVYTFRLPFFGANVSFHHGKKVEFSFRTIKVNSIKKEKAEKKAKDILSSLFKFYISFIRCWVAKNYLSYEEAYSILEHYSKNDGIITVPEFAENDFKNALDVYWAVSNGSTPLNPLEFIEICRDYMVKPVCINKSINIVECPHCLAQAVCDDGGVVTCSECGKEFMGS